LAAQRSLNRGHQQRCGDSLPSDIGYSDTGVALIQLKIIVVVTPNPESRQTGAVDFQGVTLKPIGRKQVPLHFSCHHELVRDALASGALQIVLDDFIDQTVTFWILWPASRYASPKLRVFIDYVSQNLQI